MLRYVILSILVGAVHPALADGISVSQSLSLSSIPFEDSVLFEIELRWAGPQSTYLFGRSLNPVMEGLMVRGFSSSISSSVSDSVEITTKLYRYVLRPTSSGLGRIEAVVIDYVGWPDSLPGQLATEPMMLTIADPLPPPEEGAWYSVYLIGAVLAALGSSLGALLLRRMRNRKPAEPVKTTAELFLDDLALLKQEAGNDLKKFQTGLYRILAEFLERRYSLRAEGLSEGQLTDKLNKSDLSEEARARIVGWFVRAGRDKYSPVTAGPGETIRLEAEIRALFEKL